MIRIQESITLHQPPEKVYQWIKRLDFFPKFIGGVELVSYLKKNNNETISNWWVNFQGTPLRWKEREIYDDQNQALRFSLIGGDFLRYDGMWRVIKMNGGSCVNVSVTMDWTPEMKAKFNVGELEWKARLGIRWMLRNFRKGIGSVKAAGSEVIPDDSVILSELFSFLKANGQEIRGYYDHMREISPKAPFVIVVPGHGETKRDALFVSYFLAKNGFNVIRYDATDHVGESSGNILSTTLEKNKKDLREVINYIESTHGSDRVCVVASSMGARAALKAASQDARIVSLILVSGVVDVRATLKAVYLDDMIGNFISANPRMPCDVMGHSINEDFFYAAVRYGYADLNTTRDDLARVHIPITAIIGDKDIWVNMGDIKEVFQCDRHPERRIITIPDAMHQLFEKPAAAQAAMRHVTICAVRDMSGMTLDREHVLEPKLREIAVQNKVERARSRFHVKHSEEDDREFWNMYRDDFTVLKKFDDYKRLLTRMFDAAGLTFGNSVLLDAGCGVGLLTTCLMTYLKNSISERLELHPDDLPVMRFVCADFIENNLKIARQNNESVKKFIAKELGRTSPCFDFQYDFVDFNKRLPYLDNTFDYVCSNLVLPYLRNPATSLAEMFRVLKPGGKLAVSALKPHADLSQLYRNFVVSHPDEEDIEAARRLLSSAGHANSKESEGYYYSYSLRELQRMIANAGGRNLESARCFGDQANLIVACKEAASAVVTAGV